MATVGSRLSSRVLAIVGIVICAGLWGASAPLVKKLIDTFPPCTLAVLRLGIAVAVLTPVLALQGRRPRIGRDSVALGLSGVAAFNLLQNFGMDRMPAGSAVVTLLGASVVLTALLSWIVLGERCSRSMLLAMLGCLIGVSLVALFGEGASLSFSIAGLALLIAAAFAWSVYAVAGRKAPEGDMTEVMSGALIVGLLAILPFVLWERPDIGAMSVSASDALMLLLLGGLVTAGSYFCWSYGIRRLQANEANVLCSVEPAFGLLFAWWLLREGISPLAAIGAALVIASCVLVAVSGPEPAPQSLPMAVEVV